jgi:hypothetical protein
MRQLTSAFVILIVVAMIATFAVGSIVTVIHANAVLQQSIGDADGLAYIESMDDCDPFDSSTCLWSPAPHPALIKHLSRAWRCSGTDHRLQALITFAVGSVYDEIGAGSITETGRLTVNVDPWPGALVTVRSPPINRQNSRLIARPSPFPP